MGVLCWTSASCQLSLSRLKCDVIDNCKGKLQSTVRHVAVAVVRLVGCAGGDPEDGVVLPRPHRTVALIARVTTVWAFVDVLLSRITLPRRPRPGGNAARSSPFRKQKENAKKKTKKSGD